MKINLKFNATSVDEIEQTRQLPIQNCVGDTSIKMLCLFIQKGFVNEDGHIGASKNVAMSVIDDYLTESDTDDLLLDITEALVNGGFLSREIDVAKMREVKNKTLSQAMNKIEG